ncbi:MAG: hypothetical protein V1728_06075 [Candidatus Micrarchaeota archaeon]
MEDAQLAHAKGRQAAPGARADPARMEVRMTITKEAGHIISEEEAKLLIQWAWREMEEKKGFNLFKLPNLGLCIVRDEEGVIILTEKEREKALEKQ